jgi:hypothetical protein
MSGLGRGLEEGRDEACYGSRCVGFRFSAGCRQGLGRI